MLRDDVAIYMRLGLQQSRCRYDQTNWLDIAEPFKVSNEFWITHIGD